MQARALQCQRVRQGLLEDAATELIAPPGQTSEATLAAGKVSRRCIEKHLLQTVVGQTTGDLGWLKVIGKQELDRLEAIGGGGGKTIEERMFRVHHRQIGGKARHVQPLAPKAL